jgi:S1-C subfamily serine protease
MFARTLAAAILALAMAPGAAAQDYRVVVTTRDGVEVRQRADQARCGRSLDFTVLSRDPALFEGTLAQLQRIVAGIRAVLTLDCPDLRTMHLVGVVDGKTVYTGEADAESEWRLTPAADAEPDRPEQPPPETPTPDSPAPDTPLPDTPQPDTPSTAETPAVPETPPGPPQLKVSATGSGFFVDRQGYFLTNHHVIEGCKEVKVLRAGTEADDAVVVASDTHLDLALLKVATAPEQVAVFRTGTPIEPGEGVVVVGFPLTGSLAAQQIVTTGVISATAGILGDTTRFQISAPIQPGNSGGPVFDATGLVVGLAVTSLNDKYFFESQGIVPQNVNFAVKGGAAQLFLDGYLVGYETQPAGEVRLTRDIVRDARVFTSLVQCLE